MTPPGILWTWYDDRNQVELAIQIARVWFDFAKNGIDPWASGAPGIAERYRDVVKARKDMKVNKRYRLLSWQRTNVNLVLHTVIEGTFPARGAESFVEPAVMRWRFKDAMDVAAGASRGAVPSPSRRVRQAFEAIIAADEIPTAYAYLGADPEWWAPDRENFESF